MNNGCEFRERLGSEAHGHTVLSYLSRKYSHSSSVEWAERISAGLVLIDSRSAHQDTVLTTGSELVWFRPPWTEPEAPLEFTILYEDADLLAVRKPAGLPTLPGANFLKNTLLHLIRSCAPDAAPVHRLGRWTSGVVLCARNRKAGLDLMRQWSAKEVGKRYRALAAGLPDWEDRTITTPIGRVPHPLLGSLHAATPDGKPSLSRVRVLERRNGSFLCDIRIETGRPHQIRIHMASSGHPLVGDPLYQSGGVPDADSHALPGDPGYHLHAAELSFRHPVSRKEIIIRCEPPALLARGLWNSSDPDAHNPVFPPGA